jgi:hypothetical protein|tara:strand:- start:2415 stop:2585 length:171 start_codon:yes stop_codon:yes gene_type:complete
VLLRKNVARFQSKLWKDSKKATPTINWKRLQNRASFGAPDLLEYNSRRHFFIVQLK